MRFGSVNNFLATLRAIGLAAEVEVSFFSDEPKYPSYFCSPAPGCSYHVGEPYGLSIAASATEAQAKALAEFYERLCLLNGGRQGELSRWNAEAGWIDPAKLAKDPTPEMIERLRQSSYIWIDAVRIGTGPPTKIPAQSVVPHFGSREERIVEATGSTGAALGNAADDGARDRGLFEVIERHAIARLSLEEKLQRRITELPSGVDAIETTLQRYGLKPSVFLLPAKYDTPCVLVVLADHSGVGPPVSLATRAAPTFAAAIYTGLFEALERRRPARIEELSRSPESERPRVYPWEPIESLREAEPLMESAEDVPCSALATTLRTADDLLGLLDADGLEVFSVDLTLPEVAAEGIEATKIVIPGLGPMPA